jgi:hypothetical protein
LAADFTDKGGLMNGGLIASVLVPVLIAAFVFVWLQRRKE